MTQKTLSEYESTGHECPTCDRVFDGEHGLKIHHKRTHGESIAGVEVTCDWCGDTYTERPYRLEERDHLFCDRECMGKWRSENFVGDDGTNYKGGPIEVECQNCGDVFTAKRAAFNDSAAKQNPTYCSNECQGEHFKTRYAGEQNPRWSGGEFAYGPGWNREQSLEIRVRDQARCVSCNKSENQTTTEGIGPLHVHHVCGARESSNPAVYNAERNLVTLCVHCHRVWEEYTPGAPPDSKYYESS